jgi:hypothetical protein
MLPRCDLGIDNKRVSSGFVFYESHDLDRNGSRVSGRHRKHIPIPFEYLSNNTDIGRDDWHARERRFNKRPAVSFICARLNKCVRVSHESLCVRTCTKEHHAFSKAECTNHILET